MEPLEIAQFAATILALVASAFLDRKIFILMNFALVTFWGMLFMLFPKMLLEMHANGTPTQWHVMASQLLGLITFGTGMCFWVFRNSTDERVSKALLSHLAQQLLSELLVVVINKKLIENAKPGKDELVAKIFTDKQHFMLMCAVLVLWLLVIMVHYIRSPQVRPTVPYYYDRQLNIHQTILYTILLVISLVAIIAPETLFSLFVRNAKAPSDSMMRLTFQMAGTFTLAQCSFIISSMDFAEKEEQGKVFLLNLLLILIQLVMFGSHIFMISAFTFMDAIPCLIVCAVHVTNSSLGYRRSTMVTLEPKESKKRH